MTRSIIAAAAVAFAGLSTAAFAEPRPPVVPVSASVPADVPAAASTAEPRYCARYALTGSRVPTKQCRTKAEWADAGVDITAK